MLLEGPEKSQGQTMFSLIEMGLQHEQQQQELMLTDIKHVFWANPLRPSYVTRPSNNLVPPEVRQNWLDIDCGLCEIGHAGNDFAFDNEKPRHREYVQGFQLASRLVTNKEFRDFVEDGGYRRPGSWLSLGWSTVLAAQWHAPLYWLKLNGSGQSFSRRWRLPSQAPRPQLKRQRLYYRI